MLRIHRRHQSGVNKTPVSVRPELAKKENHSSDSSTENESSEDGDNGNDDESTAGVTDITSKMSSLQLVPSSIRFGSRRLAGFTPRSKSTTNNSQDRN
jgi:hypothetical protein